MVSERPASNPSSRQTKCHLQHLSAAGPPAKRRGNLETSISNALRNPHGPGHSAAEDSKRGQSHIRRHPREQRESLRALSLERVAQLIIASAAHRLPDSLTNRFGRCMSCQVRVIFTSDHPTRGKSVWRAGEREGALWEEADVGIVPRRRCDLQGTLRKTAVMRRYI